MYKGLRIDLEVGWNTTGVVVWSYVKGVIGSTGKWQLHLQCGQLFLQWSVVMVMRRCVVVVE